MLHSPVSLSLFLSCTFSSFAMLTVSFNTMHFCHSLKWIPITKEPNTSIEAHCFASSFRWPHSIFKFVFYPEYTTQKGKLSLNQIVTPSKRDVIIQNYQKFIMGTCLRCLSLHRMFPDSRQIKEVSKSYDILGNQFPS